MVSVFPDEILDHLAFFFLSLILKKQKEKLKKREDVCDFCLFLERGDDLSERQKKVIAQLATVKKLLYAV